jgi:nicotinate-nucleotide pyrophosphorylase (carboxylating)
MTATDHAAGPHGLPADAWLQTLVARSLAEDVGTGDATTLIAVPPDRSARGSVVVRADGVVAGLPLLERVYAALDPAITVTRVVEDGTAVTAGAVVAHVAGPAAGLLTGERTALNFVQHLGGIATLTARYVAAVTGTRCQVLDTRKTLPGYRALAKYAVRCGGGANHRHGLYDRIMFKDNHWAAAGAAGAGEPADGAGHAAAVLATLVRRARERYPDLAVEIEVDDLDQLAAVLALDVAWILLDNFAPVDVARAVALRDAAGVRSRLEVSGNVDLATVGAFARAGADAVSVGRLTHSAPALDVALDLELGADARRPAGPAPGGSRDGDASP